ncbi:unnamed protein product, partial [Lepidochelys olivacea]
ASSQLVVTQPLSVSEPPGTRVKLSCALSNGYSIGNDRVRWYQQKSGSAPRFRFTISPDSSNNLWNFVISGVQAEDEADYYCYRWDSFSSQQLQSLKTSELVSPGGTVTLSCSLSSGAITDGNYPLWVQQRLGNVPRLIMYSTSTRPSGIPERFTGSRSGWSSQSFSSQQLQSLKASELVSPGGTVMLSCSLSSGALTDNNYPKWVQQRLGNVPRLIMHSTSTRPSGIPAGFTGSRSGNTMSLTVTGALAEDDADYYCSVWTG